MKQFLLSWTEPTDRGIASDYIIEYSLPNQPWQIYTDGISTATSGSISGLDICSSYIFRVAAINPVGTGQYSNTVTGSPLASLPSAPYNLAVSTGNKNLKLSWSVPDDGGCPINNYTIEYYKNNETSSYINTNGIDNQYILFNLINNQPYSVRVAAINTVGTGLYSSLLTGLVPVQKPDPVKDFYVYAESDFAIGLTWVEPNSVLDSYILEYSTNNAQWNNIDIVNSGTTYYQLLNFVPNNTYYFRISANNRSVQSTFKQQNLAFIPPRDTLYNKTRLLLRMGDLL